MPKPAPKAYPLNQSPLFRIRGQGQLEKILGLTWDHLIALSSAQSYKVWESSGGGKPRQIQQPVGRLLDIHQRLARLLRRIELPDYVYSRKGRSYVDNARQHSGKVPLIKTDIHRFYPSISRSMVYRMFRYRFECAADVAHCIADLCCFQRLHVPTGSPLSGDLAFFAAKPMFDALATASSLAGCRMTSYVDDVTVSGQGATKRLLGSLRQIVHAHGLKTKQRKSVTYPANAAKEVTGVILAGRELRLPNKQHHKLWKTRHELAAAAPSEKGHLLKVLRGREQQAAQIIPMARVAP